jgi:hypothetical protein
MPTHLVPLEQATPQLPQLLLLSRATQAPPHSWSPEAHGCLQTVPPMQEAVVPPAQVWASAQLSPQAPTVPRQAFVVPLSQQTELAQQAPPHSCSPTLQHTLGAPAVLQTDEAHSVPAVQGCPPGRPHWPEPGSQ